MPQHSNTCIGCTVPEFTPSAAHGWKRSRGQEAFQQSFPKIQTFRGESAFSTWLHRLTVNLVLMRRRKKTVPATSLEETAASNEEGGGPRNDVGGPDPLIRGSLDRVNIDRAMEHLPECYKTVLIPTTFKGTDTRRSPRSWTAQSRIQNPSCTRRASVSAAKRHIRRADE